MIRDGRARQACVLLLSILLAAAQAACAGNPAEPPAARPVASASIPPPSPAAASAGFRFVDVAREAGITRVTWAGRPGKDHVLDSSGTGAAWLDFDRDGRLDAYIVNAWKLGDGAVLEKGRNALYRNRGDGTFEDVTDKAGVAGGGSWGGGVAVADYDNDGWPDILVTNFGPNILYRNRGDGTFENVAARAGIEAPGWNTGAAFLDADADGDLDLYIASYIDCTLEEVLSARRNLSWKGVDQVAFGPFGLKGAPDHFFLSDGKGRFTDATHEAGLADLALAYGFGVRAADFDGDGDLDIYVANDSNANYLYRNEGGGRFQETGLWSGAAFDSHGAAQAGMGLTVGDYNGDALFDIFVTNFAEDFSTLYRGDGHGFFEDVSEATGVGPLTYTQLSWGAAFADLDNDGDADLAAANGHIYPQVDLHPEFGLTYLQLNQLLENTPGGRFVDATGRAGPGFAAARSSRAVAAGDYDNDGDLDLLITHLDEPPSLLRNDSAQGSWLALDLETPQSHGPFIGAVATVKTGDTVRIRDVSSGESYLSVHDPRPLFGLGAATIVDEVVVLWPDGARTVLRNIPTGRRVKVLKQ